MESTFRILITTDNHVGYLENDPVRGDDSWKSFEEIMYLAKDNDVDFVLQAGDLFHVNRPSKKSMFHVMKSLRTVCYGDKPLEFELLSDPSLSIDNRGLNHANFQDPNINVSIPIFAIAGNHDDSTGDELLDPMDLLSVSGLINHFGKNLQNDKITVAPLLLQKGTTQLALYGLSNVRDERLYKTFLDGGVKFLRPPNDHKDKFFNLLAVHQNHTAHTDTSYLPESFLPKFINLVIWGHEHECIPYVTPTSLGTDVLQPGSSVATSLSPAEMARKHVFILSVTGLEYKLEAIPLKTARPFALKTVDLTETDIPTGSGNKNEVIRYLTDEIETMIKETQDEWRSLQDEEEQEESSIKPPLPLIRLKVEYTEGYEIENPRRFSNRFVGQIANVNDVVLFHKKKIMKSNRTKVKTGTQVEDLDIKEVNVTGLIDNFLMDDDLNLIAKSDINEAIKVFIEKEDRNALKDFVKSELEKDFKELLKLNVDSKDEAADESQLKKGFKEILKEISKEKKLELKKESSYPDRKKTFKSSELVVDSDSDIEVQRDISVTPPRRKRPIRLSKQRAKEKVKSVEIISDSDDDLMFDSEPEEDQDEVISDGFLSDNDDLIDVPAPKPPRSKKITKPRLKITKKPLTQSQSQNVMDLVKRIATKK